MAADVVQKVAKVLDEDDLARKVFHVLEKREATDTTTDMVLEIGGMAPNAYSRGKATRLFKELEEAGCGRFVIGRKNYPSRFVWRVAPAELAADLRGRDDEDENEDVASSEATTQEATANEAQDAPAVAASSSSDWGMAPTQKPGPNGAPLVSYPFPLRGGFLELSLPSDLSSDEAQRLARFVRALASG